jgi:pimeloyl-ACP methyl ester carboxylesterase
MDLTREVRILKGTFAFGEVLTSYLTVIVLLALPISAYSQQWRDPSPHKAVFVTAEENVRLEVFDWGGAGRPVVLLAGGGHTAHVFDELAPQLATDYHVYGITRRGFGASGFAVSNNPLDRLRDDVVAVLGALKLEKPVLVGHSIAGAELSAVASSHPDRVAGLIYLEAGYPYAFDNGKGPKMSEFQIAGPRPPNACAFRWVRLQRSKNMPLEFEDELPESTYGLKLNK